MSQRVELRLLPSDTAPLVSTLHRFTSAALGLGFVLTFAAALYGVTAVIVWLVGDNLIREHVVVTVILMIVLGPFVFCGVLWVVYTASKAMGQSVWRALDTPTVVVTGTEPRRAEISCASSRLQSVVLLGARTESIQGEYGPSEIQTIVAQIPLKPSDAQVRRTSAYQFTVPNGSNAHRWYITLGLRQGLARFERSYALRF